MPSEIEHQPDQTAPQAEKAEVDRLKSEFVSMVSHELRTPLTSIKGSLGLILGGVCGEINGEVRELLTIALNNSDRLIKLINDILDISKIEAGKLKMNLEPLDLSSLIQRCVQHLAGFAQERQITIYTAINGSLPLVKADRDQIERVVTNLLSNAIKFSEVGGLIRIWLERKPGWVIVRVRDHGIGIAPEDHQRIFDKFQQLQSGTNRKIGGTGLGLSICKAIVAEHHGQIGVESALGQGSTFYFSLPTEPTPLGEVTEGEEPAEHRAQNIEHRAQSTEQKATNSSLYALRSSLDEPTSAQDRNASVVPLILTVDDDPGVREVMARVIQHAGFEAETAANGDEALQKIERLHPDLLILDVLMPEMNGFVLVRTLRQRLEAQEMPVIVLTTKDLTDEERTALTLGPTKFLTKSLITVEMLTAAMHELLRKNHLRSQNEPL